MRMVDENDPSLNWEEARLIPVSGIRNAVEQERRATSALLAVLTAVEEFGVAMTKQYGAPKGNLEAFIEMPFELSDGRKVRPDGLIRVSRGKRSWTALLEVKTGNNELKKDQVEAYLDVAKENNFDCVLTISNQIARIPGQHPVEVDKRKIKKTDLHHLSWSRVLTEAMLQRSHRGVADPDQAWILNELIRYMEHSNAGAVDFNDMGENWVSVREAVKAGTLRHNDKHAFEVAGKWEELVTFAALRLGRRLGTDVQEVISSKEKKDISIRISYIVDSMVNDAKLPGTIRIPDTISDISLVADLRAQQVVASVTFSAPKTGRAPTRINWLLRQLKNAPDSITLESWATRSRTSFADVLGNVRAKPDLLVPQDDREIVSFTVSLSGQMGLKRAAGMRSFIDSVIDTLDVFYADVVQSLKKWQPPAPKFDGGSAENKPAPAKRENEATKDDLKAENAPEKEAETPEPTVASPNVDTPADEKTTSDNPSVD